MQIRELLKRAEALPYVFFFLNFIIKLIYIDAQDICVDEPFTIYHAQFSVNDIVSFLKPTNNPPLFEILLHYWIKLFGISAFSVRFLPVLFSSLTVLFVYKIASRLFNKQTAITASFIYTFSTYTIFYSHDSRVYALFTLLTVASFYYLSKLLSNEASTRNKIWFCLIQICLIYSHYFGFIVWFVQAIYILVFYRKQTTIFLALYFICLLLYIPQIVVFLQRTFESAQNGTWINAQVNIESLYNKIVLFSNMPLVAILCLLIILVYFSRKLVSKNQSPSNTEQKSFSGEGLILIWFFVPFLLMFIISFKLPIFLDRYLIFISPAYFIMIAFMLNQTLKNKFVEFYVSAALIVTFALTVNFNPSKKRDVKNTVEYVKNNKGKNTLVIICAHDFINNFTYYFDKKIFTGVIYANEYHKMTYELNWQNVYPVKSIDEVPLWAMKKAKKIIFLDAAADFSNPNNRIYKTLKENYVEKSKKEFRDIFTVYEFKKN